MVIGSSAVKASFYWLVGVLILFTIWYLSSKYNWLGDTLLASPVEVYGNMTEAFKSGAEIKDRFYIYAWDTILRSFRGWSIALILGIFLGMLLGWLKKLNRVLSVSFEFIRSIPPIFIFPLMLVTFNYAESAYIWTIIFGCLPIMVLTVSRGVQFISTASLEILKVAKTRFSVQAFSTFMEVLPSIFLGARLTFSISLIIAIVSEMVWTPRESDGYALGSLARDAGMNFDAPMVYTCIITIGLYGYVVNELFKFIENQLGSNSEKI